MGKCIFCILIACFMAVGTLSATDPVYLNIFITDTPRLQITTEARTIYISSGRQNQSLNSNSLSINVANRAVNINNRRYGEQVSLTAELPLQLDNIEYSGEMLLSVNSNQIRVINRVEMEDYIAGVISAEIGGTSPLEALKAQAVATRTITITKVLSGKHRADGYHLCNTVHCQVYKGLSGQTQQSYRAATETVNQILLHNGRPIEAFYSSSCGGIAENSGNLWSVTHPYLTTAPDPFCINTDLIPNWNKQFIRWERTFTYNQLENIFGIRGITEVTISKLNSSHRVEEITIKTRNQNHTISGQYEIRNKLNLPSTLFTIAPPIQAGNTNTAPPAPSGGGRGGALNLIGNGYGHGVGMCQTGAIARANSGHPYQSILSFYFPNTTLDENWLLNNSEFGIRN